MAKNIEYRQCTLRKHVSDSASTVTVSYIPAKFAVRGHVVKLKRSNGRWDNGWVVEAVGASLMETDLPNVRQAIKKHRRATGDSLPRQA